MQETAIVAGLVIIAAILARVGWKVAKQQYTMNSIETFMSSINTPIFGVGLLLAGVPAFFSQSYVLAGLAFSGVGFSLIVVYIHEIYGDNQRREYPDSGES